MWPLLKLYFNPQRYFAAAYECWKAMLDASVATWFFSDFRGRRGWRNTVIWALPRCWERVHMALSLGPDGAGPLSDSSWESIQDEVMTCQDKEHREQLVKAFDIFSISFLKDVNRSTNHETPVSFKRNASFKRNTIIWCDKTLEISQVVKLQGPRWASVAAQEWAHGWDLSAACGLFVARSVPCPTRRLLQTWEHRCSFGGLLWERCKSSQKMEMYQI